MQIRNNVFRTEQQNARSSDNILGHGRVPVSDQPNLERSVLPESIREVEEYQVQLLERSNIGGGVARATLKNHLRLS
jgi:hypothetical protein